MLHLVIIILSIDYGTPHPRFVLPGSSIARICSLKRQQVDILCSLRSFKIFRDGNCLFHAIFLQLHVEPSILKVCMLLLINHHFAEHIRQTYVWGATIATATLFGMDIYVATDTHRRGMPIWLKYTWWLHQDHTWLLCYLTGWLDWIFTVSLWCCQSTPWQYLILFRYHCTD